MTISAVFLNAWTASRSAASGEPSACGADDGPSSSSCSALAAAMIGRSCLAARSMVVEGGWTSATVGTVVSTPDKQARYITRHGQLLDGISARGLVQLVFADLDLSAFPPPLPANLPLFTSIGLTDSRFTAKPALAAWDALFARRRVA